MSQLPPALPDAATVYTSPGGAQAPAAVYVTTPPAPVTGWLDAQKSELAGWIGRWRQPITVNIALISAAIVGVWIFAEARD